MIIDKENENVRLDRYIRNNCKENTLSEIFKAIRNGDIKVNGKKSKENYRLCLGDEVEVKNLKFMLQEKKYNSYNKNMIFFENEDILIINKPSGIAMHKGTNNEKGLSELFNVDFANRLDKKTSGLVIACKNKRTTRYITELIRQHKIEKEYVAVCKKNDLIYNLGDIFEIDKDIDGKKSKTIFKVIGITNDTIKFRVKLITGRKHQIRIHLSSIGLYIIGDDKYGNYDKKDELKLKCVKLAFDNYIFEI